MGISITYILISFNPGTISGDCIDAADFHLLPGSSYKTAGRGGKETGWNRIGFLPQTRSSTYYDGYGWFGELTIMKSPDGFMLKTSHAGTLVYPCHLSDSERSNQNI